MVIVMTLWYCLVIFGTSKQYGLEVMNIEDKIALDPLVIRYMLSWVHFNNARQLRIDVIKWKQMVDGTDVLLFVDLFYFFF